MSSQVLRVSGSELAEDLERPTLHIYMGACAKDWRRMAETLKPCRPSDPVLEFSFSFLQ